MPAPKIDDCRFDRVGRVKVRRTDEGFMYVDAAVTRTGVFNYRLADGTLRRELRHPDNVFSTDSLDTLKLKPVTNNHPEGLLDSATARQHQIGTTGENVRHDERYVSSTLAITDADTVKDVENGKRELSCGYRCELVPEKGNFDGFDYDFRQTNIRYNHVAVVDRGRAGADVAITLDHIDGIDVDKDNADPVMDAVLSYEQMQNLPDEAFAYVKTISGKKVRKFPVQDAAHCRNALARLSHSDLSASEQDTVLAKILKKAKQFGIETSKDSADNNPSQRRKSMPMIKLNGIEYDAAQEVVNHVTKLDVDISTQATTIAESKKNLDTVSAERDTAKAKLDEQQKRLDNLPTEIATAVKSRLDLERKASKVLAADTKFDTMTDKEIKLAVIKAKAPEANMDGKSDEYVQARFDSTLETAATKTDGDDEAIAKQRAQSKERTDGANVDKCDADVSRKAYMDRLTGKKPEEKK